MNSYLESLSPLEKPVNGILVKRKVSCDTHAHAVQMDAKPERLPASSPLTLLSLYVNVDASHLPLQSA